MEQKNEMRTGERVSAQLRELFSRCGYQSYKMSRFEEYELYVKNKDFLTSDRMIVFTDLNGSLMALKPDVTISIIKNTQAEPGTVRRVCYTENVYRADAKANAFKEIMQAGLECIGDIDSYNLAEVILLAVKSLATAGEDYVLDISHLGFMSGAFAASGLGEELYSEALRYISGKNLDGFRLFCEKNGLEPELLSRLITTSGRICEVLDKIEGLCRNEAMRASLDELRAVAEALRAAGLDGNVRLDFSVVNDMRYYSGLVFQGYIRGLPVNVLSGGQYDSLMRKMDKKAGAIGFAVYLDQLEALDRREDSYDADVLLLYSESDPASKVAAAVESLTRRGKTVAAQKKLPEKPRYREIISLNDWSEDNA